MGRLGKLGVDSIEKVPYRIGYSFRNPSVVKKATQYRKPFWEMNYAAYGPSQVRADFWKSKKLNRFPSVWRRAAKMGAVNGLGDIEERVEMPDFYELGQAPGPTEGSVTGQVERSPLGTLMNLALTGVQTVMTEQNKLDMAKKGMYFPGTNIGVSPYLYSQQSGIGTVGWGVIVLGTGALAYFLFKK